jgi:hypothetical protein
MNELGPRPLFFAFLGWQNTPRQNSNFKRL